MSSAYGSIPQVVNTNHLDPFECTLKDGSIAKIVPMETIHVDEIRSILNKIIIKGKTYPQVEKINISNKNWIMSSLKTISMQDSFAFEDRMFWVDFISNQTFLVDAGIFVTVGLL